MRPQSAYLLLSTLVLAVNAAPQTGRLVFRQAIDDTSPACLPQNDHNPEARKTAVAARDKGFIYGPSLIGKAAFFPNGTLGNARTQADMALWQIDRTDIDDRVTADVAVLQKAIIANKGLNSLDDYTTVLYQDEWKNANPLGTAPGIMTNYTQDLLFSMERLSQNSYPLELVRPDSSIPFQVDEDLVSKITGSTLEDLQKSGSLFFVDHQYQAAYEKTKLLPQRYGGACTALFYIHPTSGDFLPLAIKTNAGSDLIYTPQDSPPDWLFAKMAFNVNDFFHSQMFHLVVTHDVSEAVHQAALHTLSESHPIMIILERLMLQAYSSRVVGEELCFNPGGHWDQLFYVDNVGCRQFVTDTWPIRGRYEDSYLETDLQARGLLNATNGYKFKSFPFYQDAKAIRDSYTAFFTEFVHSYYPTDTDLSKDFELHNWFQEATDKAQVPGFPDINNLNRQTLIEVLTHFGYIVSVVHHSLNGGDPVGSKATLPFHLNALYAPLPEKKGLVEKDLLAFLPNATNAVHYIGFLATFNRPFYATSERTMEWAFSNDTMLHRLNADVNTAASTFWASMANLSLEIRARVFDNNGLSMGMPFIYRTLDPNYIPFFSAV